MTLEPVTSGHIVAMGWEDGVMVVEFKGGAQYAYNTGYDTYKSIIEAGSVGSALHRSGLVGSRI